MTSSISELQSTFLSLNTIKFTYFFMLGEWDDASDGCNDRTLKSRIPKEVIE